MQRILIDYIEEDRGHSSRCWISQRAKSPLGYAFSWCPERKITILHHRLLYEKANGIIREGFVLDHLCRIPSCVNPNHMEVVTQRVNTIRGKSAKLSQDQVDEIRRRAELGERRRNIAKDFGVVRRTVNQIVARESWQTK